MGSSPQTTTFTYDARGNQTGRGKDTFTWDHENRMTQAVIGGATSSYVYNGSGVTGYTGDAMETESGLEIAEETREEASIIIVSDFVCPWCYIGLMEVERLSREYDFEVHMAPYLLRPETPPDGIPARHIVPEGAPPTATEERAANLGIKFTRGRTITSNSHLSLEASAFAHDYGDQWLFHRAMFKAYFEDLEDIGSVDAVVKVGAAVGLHAGDLRTALQDGIYREQIDAGIEWSRGIGVTAVPTFIFNERFAMVGAHELPAFRDAMEQAGQPPRA